MTRTLLNLIFTLSAAWLFTTSLVCAAMPADEISWMREALKLQHHMDDEAPLNEATFIGTHNSFNSSVYSVAGITYLDPNQRLSLYDQLEAGVRSIELDMHWTLASDFSHAVLLCHGRSDHLGCSPFDRRISEALKEIEKWLKANPREVVLIYIERHLDGHESKVAEQLNRYLREFIYTPISIKSPTDTNACVAIPGTIKKSDVLKAGKQVLIVTKRCDAPSPNREWNETVFAGMGPMSEGSFTFLDPNIKSFQTTDCGKSAFSADPLHRSLWRITEDRTVLSNSVEKLKEMHAEDMRNLMRCGINWPAMDQMKEDDDRLRAAIWSWAPHYPQSEGGHCAIYQLGEGIKNQPCEVPVSGFACRESTTREMKAIPGVGDFQAGERFCQAMGSNWHFAAPFNGEQLQALETAMQASSITRIGLNYAQDTAGQWRVLG